MSAMWEQFSVYAARWQVAGDQDRLRLISGYHEGIRHRESQPDLQFDIMTRCRDEARRLGEPWWELFFDHWRIEAVASAKHDFGRALPLAIEAMARFSSPEGRSHPCYNSMLIDILYIYSEIDPFGYRDELERGFEVLDERIGAGVSTDRFVVDYRRIAYLHATERRSEAHELAHQSLDIANLDNNRWHASWALFMLCRICHARHFWEELAAHAEAMKDHSTQASDYRRTLADAWFWLALTERARGDERRAARSFQTGLRHNEKLDRRNELCAEPIAAYYELLGDWKAAAGVRKLEINDLERSGALHAAALAHIERCRLLKLGGALGEAELSQAREAAGRLRQPAWHLEKLVPIVSDIPGLIG